MSNPSADIEEPQGDPGGISRAAGDLSRQSSSFWDTSQQLRSLPGSLTTWQGPASVAFAGTALAYADDAAAASDALALAARVAQAFADELADAQADARRAQGEASAARAQIARAQAKLADAQAGIAAAKAASGAGVLLASSLLEVAEADERQAKIDLERARDDLERALADQRKANTRAGAASRGLQQALQVELGLRSPGSLPPLTPLPPFATSGALGVDYWNAASMFFTVSSGAMAFASGKRKRAKADAGKERLRARIYDARREDPSRTPDERAADDRRYRRAIAQRDANKARLPGLKAVSRLGKIFGVGGIPLQYAANSGKMSRTENLTRTGFSAAFATAGGSAGVVCGPLAVACGATFALGASWVGDKAGGVAYDEGRRFVRNLRFWGNRR